GKSSCGPALWSPDGRFVYAPDVVGKSILIARSDGSGQARSIALEHPIDLANGPGGLLAWQAIAPRERFVHPRPPSRQGAITFPIDRFDESPWAPGRAGHHTEGTRHED